MKYSPKFFLFIFIILSFFSSSVFSIEGLVSQEKVHERIKTVEEMKDLDEETKARLLEVYTKILDRLDSINSNNQQSTVFEATSKQASEETKQLEAELAKQEQAELEPQPEQSSEQMLAEINKFPLAELEQKYNSELANLSAITAKNSDLKQSLDQEVNSAPDIRKRLIEVNQLLEQKQEAKKLPLVESNDYLLKAKQWLLDVQIEVLRSEIKMLDLRLLSQPARLRILKLEIDLSNQGVKKVERHTLQLKQQLDLKRSSKIKKTQEITQTEQSEAQGKHPLIESLAERNTLLSEVIIQRSQELMILEASDDVVFKETQRIKDEKANVKKKLDIAGLNQILGQVLWEQKKDLPDSKQYLNNLKERKKIIAEVGLEHIQYQEELSNIKDREKYLAELALDISPETVSLIQNDLLKLIETRKTLLEDIVSTGVKYINAITELDFAEKELIEVATSYAQLIDENVFWLRSSAVLSLGDFTDITKQAQFLLTPSHWLKFISDFSTMTRSSYQVVLGLLFFAFLLLKRIKIKELLIKTGQKTKKISTDSLTHTWKALFYTLLLAMPVPMLLWVVGWQLGDTEEASAFSHAVGIGMLAVVLPLFSLSVFRVMCLPRGLFEIHFKWSADLISDLRKEMGRLMHTFVPIVFVIVTLVSIGEIDGGSDLRRLFILFAQATFALFFYRLLHPNTGFLTSVRQSSPQSFFVRHQTILFFFGLTSIVILMGMTTIGYVYTAVKVTRLLIDSIWFIFVLVILQQMSTRWLLIARRRYALKKAYEKRQEAQAQKQENEKGISDVPGEDIGIEIEEPEVDMLSLSDDSQKLLNLAGFILTVSGFVFMWSDALPALSIFEKITLWHRQGIVEGVEALIPVTLADLALAIMILVMTILGAKRFPAIIELLMLQNNNISSGERYTATTLTNYAIYGIGFFVVFNILGADWNRFQWLFAALSVGIGFGLQEIVANFISGLIILFERPIRVGDHISVGQNEGVVSRIQIRATTITTYDRKELLVPNKEFITGQLVNLSLSDPIARIVIPLGVAYGSDVAKARQLMLEAAEENESVLKEPVSTVMFREFGDNSLNLELRCYIANVDHRVVIASEVNEAINEKFNAVGICIAFPQRDVHLDINQPIDIRLQGKPE